MTPEMEGFWYDREGKPIFMDEYIRLRAEDNTYYRVALYERDGYRISTVWVGFDMSLGMGGPPLIFETMVFGDSPLAEDARKYSTEQEALAGHLEMIKLVELDRSLASEVVGQPPRPEGDAEGEPAEPPVPHGQRDTGDGVGGEDVPEVG